MRQNVRMAGELGSLLRHPIHPVPLARLAGQEGSSCIPSSLVLLSLESSGTITASSVSGVPGTDKVMNRSQEELVQELERQGLLKSETVKQAMMEVDRKNYVPFGENGNPYEDAPQRIGYGATISAPHMHATVLEVLKDKLSEGSRVLDVGSGSGYLTACLALMVGPTGTVVGIDHIPELVELSKNNLLSDKQDLHNVTLVVGDGRNGYPQNAPYDAIHVGAACLDFPADIVEQLAPGGRMVAPVGDHEGYQYLERIDRLLNGAVTRTKMMGVRYVPLTQKRVQLSRTYY